MITDDNSCTITAEGTILVSFNQGLDCFSNNKQSQGKKKSPLCITSLVWLDIPLEMLKSMKSEVPRLLPFAKKNNNKERVSDAGCFDGDRVSIKKLLLCVCAFLRVLRVLALILGIVVP